MIENATRVTVIDDLTVSADLAREPTAPLETDSADVQAMMALEAGALADAIARLSLLPRRSWILIASSIERLIETVGEETAERLLAVADQAELAQRPDRTWTGKITGKNPAPAANGGSTPLTSLVGPTGKRRRQGPGMPSSPPC
ncbi:hypothetical protein [Streptomyces lydicus]|uniref:hypothetical protein n=1 Tax=Streptomyces lydicus TaxID=47763 RepID=UPI0036E7EA5A